MLLAGHAFDGGALLRPDRPDIEQHVGLPVALLGLMRLEEEDGWGTQHLLTRIIAMRLGGDAGMLREIGHGRVVVVVDVLFAVCQHEFRMGGAHQIHHAEQAFGVQRDGVVAEVPELDVVYAENLGGRLGLLLALHLHALQIHSRLTPELGGFAALAIGEADHRYLEARGCVERDGAAGAPDEIGGMGGDNQRGLVGHSGRSSVPRDSIRTGWRRRMGRA